MVYLVWTARSMGHRAPWFFVLEPGRRPRGNWKDAKCVGRWLADHTIDPPMFTVREDLERWLAAAGARPEPGENKAGA